MPRLISLVSIERAQTDDHETVLVACRRDLSAAEVAGLPGDLVSIDGAQFVVHDISPEGKPIRAGRPFLLRVGKPS